MPLFPLVGVVIVASAIRQSWFLCLTSLALYGLVRNGQSIYSKIGVGCLIGLVLIQSGEHSVPTDPTLIFEVDSRRENGSSVRLYGEADGVKGVLRGNELQKGSPRRNVSGNRAVRIFSSTS